VQKWLRARPAAATLAELQAQLDTFTELFRYAGDPGVSGGGPDG
jgi:hypothetical protein